MPCRTQTNRIPKYRHHRPSGQAVVTLSGKDIYIGQFGTQVSRDRYDRLISQWMAAGRRLPSDDGATVAELLAGFLTHAERHYRRPDGQPGGELSNMKIVLKLLRVYDDIAVDSFTPAMLKGVRQAMIDKGWSRRAINRNVVRVRTIFKWGVAESMVHPSTLQALQAVSGLQAGRSDARETARIRALTELEIEQAKKYMPQVLRDMVDVQLLTGMRPGELVAMRPIDIDTAGRVWFYRPTVHKTSWTGRDRTIAIGPRAQAALEKYLSSRPIDRPCFSPAEAAEQRAAMREAARTTPRSCGNVRGSNRKSRPEKQPGEAFTSNTYAQAVRYACERAGMKDGTHWTPNQLRHTAGTRIRAEAGLETARTVLGHSTASVTEKFYAEADQQKAARIIARVG